MAWGGRGAKARRTRCRRRLRQMVGAHGGAYAAAGNGSLSHTRSSPHWKIDGLGPESEQLGEAEEDQVAAERGRRGGEEGEQRIERA